MKQLYLFLVASIICTSSYGQQELENYYQKANQFLHANQMDSSLFYYLKVDSIALIVNDTLKIKEARFFQPEYLNILGKKEEAIPLFEALFPYLQSPYDSLRFMSQYGSALSRFNKTKADSVYQLGLSLQHLIPDTVYDIRGININYGSFLVRNGQYAKSIAYLERGLELAINDYHLLICYTNLCAAFIRTNNMLRAEEYILKSVAICDKNNFKSRHGYTGANYASLLGHQKKYDQALAEIEKSINYFSSRNNVLGLSHAVYGKIQILINSKKWSEAKEAYDTLEKLISKENKELLAKSFIVKAKLQWQQKNFSGVIASLQKVEQICDRQNYPYVLAESLELKSKAYYSIGKSTLAFVNLESSIALNDSLDFNAQMEFVTQSEAKYKRKEQDQQISLLNTQNKARATIVKQQKNAIIGGGIGLGLISILSILLYRYLQRTKAQKEIITQALSQKDILLREIHHRVKNNLQLVSSLLTLQGRSIKDEKAQLAIKEGNQRVRSMALIHQDLYNKENLTGIDVKIYLEKLSAELVNTYAIDSNLVTLTLDISSMTLDIDTIIPLGLIINELVTNSLKYAFPEKQKGTLKIALHEVNGQLVLIVEDNGIGFDPLETNSNSFGTTLIQALTSQLDGSLQVESENGTKSTLNFNDYKIAS